MQNVLFVSVAQSFEADMSLPELEPWVEQAWPLTVAKASAADRVIAVIEDQPIAAWRIRGVYPTSLTYRVATGDDRPRIGLSLGDSLPILPEYRDGPGLRRGCAVKQIDVAPLPSER